MINPHANNIQIKKLSFLTEGLDTYSKIAGPGYLKYV
jgi:hypothetical protein